MSRVYNFSAGPAALPLEVLERIRADIPDWNGTGMSVMEVSHRGKAFMDTAAKAEQDLRDLLSVPDDYSVLFVQGGATMHFSMVPLNLAGRTQTVDYLQTGSWSKKAVAEARRYCKLNIAADSGDRKYTYIPPPSEWRLSREAAYVHYTPNETIDGVEFHFIPQTDGVPLVADMSSTILSRPINVSRFGIIYAGAQKNIGPAGITLVIVRKDLLEPARKDIPSLLTYKIYAESDSMTNTPPTFAWYVAGLVFEHLKELGGLDVMGQRNKRKADKLYAAVDASDFYSNPVEPDCRSWMNVPFVLANPALDSTFLAGAEQAGLTNLKGHRSVGGMRASIYNATSEDAVDALIQYMREFERKYG